MTKGPDREQTYGYLRRFVPDFVIDQRLIPELVSRASVSIGNAGCLGKPMEIISELRQQGVSDTNIGVATRTHLGIVCARDGYRGRRIEQIVTRLLLEKNGGPKYDSPRRPGRPIK